MIEEEKKGKSTHRQRHTSHVLVGLDGLEADEGDLHGEQRAQHIQSAVGHVHAMRIAPAQQQHQHVQRNQVDNEDVASPCRHLWLRKSERRSKSERRRARKKQQHGREDQRILTRKGMLSDTSRPTRKDHHHMAHTRGQKHSSNAYHVEIGESSEGSIEHGASLDGLDPQIEGEDQSEDGDTLVIV